MPRELTPPQREAIRQALRAGRKLDAVKLHREATGEGLFESKQHVEAMEAELGGAVPPGASHLPKRSGCLGLLIGGVTALTGVVGLVIWILCC